MIAPLYFILIFIGFDRFASNNVYLIVSESQQTPTKRVYVKKRKTISSENINSEEENLLLHKALYFQKEFKKNH